MYPSYLNPRKKKSKEDSSYWQICYENEYRRTHSPEKARRYANKCVNPSNYLGFWSFKSLNKKKV